MKRLSIILIAITVIALATSAFAGMKKYVYKDGELGQVTFDGQLHIKNLGPRCNDCHKDNMPFDKKMPGTEGSAKITKADHVDGKFCGVCHDGTKAFAWKEGSDCTKCHKKAAAATAPAVAPAAVPAPAAATPAPTVAPAPEKK